VSGEYVAETLVARPRCMLCDYIMCLLSFSLYALLGSPNVCTFYFKQARNPRCLHRTTSQQFPACPDAVPMEVVPAEEHLSTVSIIAPDPPNINFLRYRHYRYCYIGTHHCDGEYDVTDVQSTTQGVWVICVQQRLSPKR
jgi:hypothetical protein